MFQTGEFSRLARISKRMLQHYDRIGLFSPEYTDSQTGYRYYSAHQLPRLNRILALKDLGLTLEQVHRMIDDDITIDEMRGMLLLQKAELEKTLQESIDRIQRVESRLNRLEKPRDKRPEVVLKTVPEMSYLRSRQIISNIEHGEALLGQLLTALPSKVGKNTLGQFMSIMHSPVFELENNDSELGFVINQPVEAQITLDDDFILTTRKLDAVEMMATVVQVGRFDMLPEGYVTITEWMEANGYRPIGAQRELYLEIPQLNNPDDLVTEIQFPVEKINPNKRLSTTLA